MSIGILALIALFITAIFVSYYLCKSCISKQLLNIWYTEPTFNIFLNNPKSIILHMFLRILRERVHVKNEY